MAGAVITEIRVVVPLECQVVRAIIDRLPVRNGVLPAIIAVLTELPEQIPTGKMPRLPVIIVVILSVMAVTVIPVTLTEM